MTECKGQLSGTGPSRDRREPARQDRGPPPRRCLQSYLTMKHGRALKGQRTRSPWLQGQGYLLFTPFENPACSFSVAGVPWAGEGAFSLSPEAMGANLTRRKAAEAAEESHQPYEEFSMIAGATSAPLRRRTRRLATPRGPEVASATGP